jgi:predicted trehalose synthase
MKLYTDNKGSWAGTQSDAKQFGEYEQVEVPTDKPTLLEFLNEYQVGAADVVSAQMEMVQQKTHPLSCSGSPNVYEVKDAVLNCDRKHLAAALGAIISRIHDEMEDE